MIPGAHVRIMYSAAPSRETLTKPCMRGRKCFTEPNPSRIQNEQPCFLLIRLLAAPRPFIHRDSPSVKDDYRPGDSCQHTKPRLSVPLGHHIYDWHAAVAARPRVSRVFSPGFTTLACAMYVPPWPSRRFEVVLSGGCQEPTYRISGCPNRHDCGPIWANAQSVLILQGFLQVTAHQRSKVAGTFLCHKEVSQSWD